MGADVIPCLRRKLIRIEGGRDSVNHTLPVPGGPEMRYGMGH